MQELVNKQELLAQMKEEFLKQLEQTPADQITRLTLMSASYLQIASSAPIVQSEAGATVEDNAHAFFIPQFEDWDRLLDVVGEEDAVIHWNAVCFWVDTLYATREMYKIPDAFCALRGYTSARSWTSNTSSAVNSHSGFRPALKYLSPDHLVPGQKLQRYALYLDGVEQDMPMGTDRTDIAEKAIEFKESTRPETAITWLYNGSCFIADRVLLSNVSFDDLEKQGFRQSC